MKLFFSEDTLSYELVSWYLITLLVYKVKNDKFSRAFPTGDMSHTESPKSSIDNLEPKLLLNSPH